MLDEVFGAVSYATGEFVVWLVGKIIGHTFGIEPKKAKKIGELVIFFVLIGEIVIITFMYS